MEFKKNDICRVTIEDIGTDGEGIGKIDGFTLFIKDAVLGDTIEAKIMKAKKNYAYAKLEKVLTPSPFRVQPKCQFHKQCGGCQIQAMEYTKQLEFKHNKVRNNLIRIGGLDAEYVDSIMEEPVGMEIPFYYRNKAQFPFGKNKSIEEKKTIWKKWLLIIIACIPAAVLGLLFDDILDQYLKSFTSGCCNSMSCIVLDTVVRGLRNSCENLLSKYSIVSPPFAFSVAFGNN